MMDATGDLMSDDPYTAVTPALRPAGGTSRRTLNLHFHTLARGSVTAWVDAQP